MGTRHILIHTTTHINININITSNINRAQSKLASKKIRAREIQLRKWKDFLTHASRQHLQVKLRNRHQKRQRKYDETFLQYGFTSITENNEEKPKCPVYREHETQQAQKTF